MPNVAGWSQKQSAANQHTTICVSVLCSIILSQRLRARALNVQKHVYSTDSKHIVVALCSKFVCECVCAYVHNNFLIFARADFHSRARARSVAYVCASATVHRNAIIRIRNDCYSSPNPSGVSFITYMFVVSGQRVSVRLK